MKKILVTMPMEQHHRDCLEKAAPGCSFTYANAEATDEQIQAANIIIGDVKPPQRIHGSENLEWIQLNSAGADPYCKAGVLAEKTILTNATGAYGLAISEYMLGVLLTIQKKLDLYHDNQKKHLWRDEGSITSIDGSTTVVLGLGDIGGEFAKKMKALGSRVIGVKRNMSEKPDYVDELYTTGELDKVLPQADILAMSLPNTSETYRIMDERRLGLMKDTAILINVGRGTAVDTDALCRALMDGKLGGCCLDVTDPEPLPEDHPIWDAPRAVITPHISGQYHLQETFERIVRIAAANLDNYLNGRPMINIVDISTGYRKFQQ